MKGKIASYLLQFLVSDCKDKKFSGIAGRSSGYLLKQIDILLFFNDIFCLYVAIII